MKRLIIVVGLGLLGLIFALTPLSQISAQGNQQLIEVMGSQQYTATTLSNDQQTGLNVEGAYFVLNVTGALTTPLITPSIQLKDPVSGNYSNIMVASTGVSTIGTYTYLLYPATGTAAFSVTQVANYPLPNSWRVVVTHLDTDPITYSIGALLVQ